MSPNPAYLTRAQVAARLDVSTRTLDRLLAAGLIEPVRLIRPGCTRGRVLFSEAGLASYLAGPPPAPVQRVILSWHASLPEAAEMIEAG
jgi:hypothetical protein